MAQKKRKTDSADARYEEIVSAAGEIFSEKGYSATSLNDIADAVGVLKGSLYHYINSKEELLFDVVKVAHQGLLENMRLADHFSGDPLRQIAAFSYGHIVLNAVTERIHRGVVFLSDSRYLHPDKLKLVNDVRDSYERYLRTILTTGQKKNLIDGEIDPRMCSFEIFGVLNSYMRWFKPEKHARKKVTAHVIGRESAAFVLSSVMTPEQRQKVKGRFLIVDEVAAEVDGFRAAP